MDLVHHPVLDGLRDMRRADVRLPRQISDRPRNLEHPIVGPGAESQLGHRHLQQLFPFGADGAMTLDVLRAHSGVGVDPSAFEPSELDLTGSAYPFPDLFRAFGFDLGDDVPELDLRHLDLDVDAIEKRTGDLGVIAALLGLGAVALCPAHAAEDVLTPLRCPFAI